MPNGAKVFIDPRSLKLLDGTVLDFDEDNLMATSFTLKNPHAKSTCGCGESLSRLRDPKDLKTLGPQELL